MSVNTSRIDEEQKEVLKKDTLIRLFKYLLVYKKQISVVLLIMAGTIAISMATPIMMEYAINVCVASGDVKGLLKLGALAVVMFLFFLAGTKIRMYIMSDVSNQVLLNIRDELYRHIQTLSFGFFDSRPTGKILARIIGDVNSLKDVLSDSVTQLIPDLITVVCVAVIMLIKNYRLAMAALLTLPILVVGMLVIETTAHKRWQIYRDNYLPNRSEERREVVTRHLSTPLLWRTDSARWWRLPGGSADFCCILSASASSVWARSASVHFSRFLPILPCSGVRSGTLPIFIIS